MVLRDLLEIILKLVEKKPIPKEFIEQRSKLQPVLIEIYQLAEAENLVILDSLCSKLLMLLEEHKPK